MAQLMALKRKRARGQAAIEAALVVPFLSLILIVIVQLAIVIFRAQRNLARAEQQVGTDVLTHEGATTLLTEHPCLEHIAGGGQRAVADRDSTLLGRVLPILEEVTFVVDPICRY